MKQPDSKPINQKGVCAAGLLRTVNQLRRDAGHEEVGLMGLAYLVSKYHEDRNPIVAKALDTHSLTIMR